MFFLLLLGILLLMVVASYYGGRRIEVLVPTTYRVEHLPHNRGLYASLLVMLCGVPPLLLGVIFSQNGPLWLLDVLYGSDFWSSFTATEKSLLLAWVYSTLIEGNSLKALPFVDLADVSRLLLDLDFYWISWRVCSVVVLLLAGGSGFFIAYKSIRRGIRTRTQFEKLVKIILSIASLIAVFTSFAIAFSLVFESWRFFYYVDVWDFFLGLNWEPQITFNDATSGENAFGLLPVLWGTLMISLIALLIATPLGLLSAVYLNAYAGVKFRMFAKPALELLAGIPTIVYGFIAVLLVAPAFHNFGEWLGFVSEPNNALAAGAVLGMMLIPFISSFADDALNEVSLSMRYGSYALGATDAETMFHVMLPSAFPGIASGVLLAASRAIGETMIVVMAAGLVARFAFSPFEGVTTMTVQIVAMLVGDTSFDSPKTLSAFALGITLFTLTLGLNLLAFWITSRFRKYVV